MNTEENHYKIRDYANEKYFHEGHVRSLRRIQKSDELPILAARRARLAVLFYRYEGIAESSELPVFTVSTYLIENS